MQIFNFQFLPPQRDTADCGAIFNKRSGFTLVETLVGVALVTIVFTGVFGAYRLGLKVVGVSKNKIVATSIANTQIEKIRNLSYESVGVENASLPFASGSLDPEFEEVMNNTRFNVSTQVRFISDEADGVGASDPCNLDYKKADVTVSWSGNFNGSLTLSTNISPKNKVQELQSCLSQPGGVLSVTVFDGGGILVPAPNIAVYDPMNNNLVATATPASGKYSFPLESGTYRVEISKSGYSYARTYGSADSEIVAVPDSPNSSVLEGGEVPLSLSIDRTGSFSIDGITPDGQDDFADSFDDASQISGLDNAEIVAGNISLSSSPYNSSGYAISKAIVPADLVAWNQLRFSDNRPAGTDAFYQVLYYDGVGWVLVPDSDLGGNSAGFRASPISLAGLDKGDYPQIKIKGNLSTGNTSLTSRINSWQVFWTTDSGTAVPAAAFHVQGTKTIGENAAGQKVYKYSQDLALDGAGHLNLADIDADSYVFSVNPTGGSSLIATDPAPQPVNLASGGAVAVKLFLRSQNSLLVTVQNDNNLDPVFSATVRLSDSGSGYDKTQYTDQKGQTYFAPLNAGTYSISVTAPGFAAGADTVSVSGPATRIINIQQNE